MEITELSFAKIIKLDADMAEVIVNDGIEYDMDMLEEYHAWICNNMQTPSCILVNKVNDYTYTFEVQRKLAAIPEIRAIAHLVYSRASKLATQAMIDLPKVAPWNTNIFHDRESALQWLQEQRQTDICDTNT